MTAVDQTFPRVRRWARGYDPEQVETFLAQARVAYDEAGRGSALTSWHVRTVGFDLVRGGYQMPAVDAALDRIEDAFAGREKRRGQREGASAWQSQVRQQEIAVRSLLGRPEGQRFPRGVGMELTYDVDGVDELCRRLDSAFAAGRPLPADEVRQAVFRGRRGAKGYREGAVDAFLDRVVELLVLQAV